MADLITLGAEIDVRGGAQANRQMQQFRTNTIGAAKASDQLQVQQSRLGRVMHNNRFAMQNTAFQLQDIIVQLEMGIPVTRTLGQQLPQLLGSFGAMGAVAGVAAGAFFSFLPLLLNIGKGADEAADAIDDLIERLNTSSFGDIKSSVEALRDAQDAYNMAIARSADLGPEASNAIIAASRSEFEARKQVLEVEMDIMRLRQQEASANLRNLRDIQRINAEAPFDPGGRGAEQSSARAMMEGRTLRPGEERIATLANLFAPRTVEEARGPRSEMDQDLMDERARAIKRLDAEIRLGNIELERAAKIFDEEFTPGVEGGASAQERLAKELAKTEGATSKSAATAAKMTDAEKELEKQREKAMREMSGFLSDAFFSVVDGARSAGDALLDFVDNVLMRIAEQQFAQRVADPLATGLSGIIGGIFGNAKGNVFGPGGVHAFASGGIVNGPTVFPFANGVGLMGEAGPEAIMPLSRGRDGKLGVSGGGTKVTINNYSNQQAEAQTAANGDVTVTIGRAVAADITAGGPSYKAIRQTFGLGQPLQRRG